MARHTLSRSLHDVGLAAWFGGSLMGAVGLNGAAASLTNPDERSAAATVGWSRWAPLNVVAVGAHLVGAVQLLRTERGRIARQDGVARSSAVKTVLTGAALASTAYSGALNRKMAASGHVPVHGATEPAAGTPTDVASTQKQLQAVQWLIPALTGALVSVTAWQSEQMRPKQVARGSLPSLSLPRLSLPRLSLPSLSLPELPARVPALAGAAAATATAAAVLVRVWRRRSAATGSEPDHAQTVADLAAQSRAKPAATPASTTTPSSTGSPSSISTPSGTGTTAAPLGESDPDAVVIRPSLP